ncbi:flagellin fljK [Asticcacaulis biprosthecium C19]|uniref:Flagellin n=1 Tax=Asticcacaulis biprosthecium C19 TaxID=715226 RepID=F4QQ87_9CAUL|nr:flagellin [Asticcacaulis biprosthecium]EGF90374.1 flagellin fljK [Asticcacaulis biprosthecium C19]
MNSINTNLGAMVALQNLNKITADLRVTQNRISTGLKVSSAKDDGAIYAIAQSQRAEIKSLDSVKMSLSRTSSTVDVAMTAGESIQDMLTELKEKALAASDTSLDTTSRDALKADFAAIRNQITKTIANATFNGINLLNGSRATIGALANAQGSSHLTVDAEDMSLGGGIITLGASTDFSTATSAQALLTTLDDSISNMSSALARLGTSSKSLDRHATFIGKLQDTMDGAVGKLVDADMAKEATKLQALQTKQQLAIQALSIANQSQSYMLSLFR